MWVTGESEPNAESRLCLGSQWPWAGCLRQRLGLGTDTLFMLNLCALRDYLPRPLAVAGPFARVGSPGCAHPVRSCSSGRPTARHAAPPGAVPGSFPCPSALGRPAEGGSFGLTFCFLFCFCAGDSFCGGRNLFVFRLQVGTLGVRALPLSALPRPRRPRWHGCRRGACSLVSAAPCGLLREELGTRRGL